MPLFYKDRGHAIVPLFLHGSEYSDLIVNEEIMFGRVTSFNIGQLVLFMNINEYVLFDGFAKAGTLDLSRLKYGIAVRKYYDRPVFLELLDNIEGAGK